jgi:arylformamidase
MKKKIIDISIPLKEGMTTWPGDPSFELIQTKSIEKGDSSNNSRLVCGTHAGTHIDAPRHFLKDGKTIEALSLDILIGPAVVADLPDASFITADDLENLNLAKGVGRLLLKTANSKLWGKGANSFKKNYVALTEDAAEWIVKRKIQLIGIDYLSVQRFKDGSRTHEVLLKNNVIIVEGLKLGSVRPGIYELACLPLALIGADGAPARAVLKK